MLRDSLKELLALVAVAGCGGGQLGEPCGGPDDCSDALQCLNLRCVEACERATDCGDGYACGERGRCTAATGLIGDRCTSEVDCASGLSCRIDGSALDASSRLLSSCAAVNPTRPAGAECRVDADCRNGTCALGRCVDLCRHELDCGKDNSCRVIPSVLANNALFSGCLPSHGTISWSIPMTRPSAEIQLPVPGGARSALLVMSVDDPSLKVGASRVLSPKGERIYHIPCSPLQGGTCDATQARDDYFASQLRHLPGHGQSVLAIPSGPTNAIGPGMYRINISSFRADDTQGNGLPRVTAVVKLDSAALLDLHFFFLDLSGHACMSPADSPTLNAGTAATEHYFQMDYVAKLRAIFEGSAGIALGTLTYEDLVRHELDDLDVSAAGSLLKHGKYAGGINVFFVRSLSPIGLQAYGPNPGPAGLGGTRQSGIVIPLDTLCYRDWSGIARITAYALARYMGLYHNVELDTANHPSWKDPFPDSDMSSNNLMYFSDLSGAAVNMGVELSAGQRQLLLRSAVLR
jgi:hypothetical protein